MPFPLLPIPFGILKKQGLYIPLYFALLSRCFFWAKRTKRLECCKRHEPDPWHTFVNLWGCFFVVVAVCYFPRKKFKEGGLFEHLKSIPRVRFVPSHCGEAPLLTETASLHVDLPFVHHPLLKQCNRHIPRRTVLSTRNRAQTNRRLRWGEKVLGRGNGATMSDEWWKSVFFDILRPWTLQKPWDCRGQWKCNQPVKMNGVFVGLLWDWPAQEGIPFWAAHSLPRSDGCKQYTDVLTCFIAVVWVRFNPS